MKNASYALAIDAGGTFFKASIVREDGVIVEASHKKAAVDSSGSMDEIIDAYKSIINDSFDYARERNIEIEGIGISTPGPFDYENSTSYMKHKFQSIYGINLKEQLRNRCRLYSEIPIKFLHDAHAFLLGEYWAGAAKGFQNVAVVVIGTGIGFGLMQKGKLLKNNQGGPYVSIFEKKWEEGILEDVVSRRGIIKTYKQLSQQKGMEDVDVVDIACYAEENKDEHAKEAFSETGRVLAQNIKDILNEMEVECLVLGGQISKSFHLMESQLKNGFSDLETLKKITMGQNIDFSTQIGVASTILKMGMEE